MIRETEIRVLVVGRGRRELNHFLSLDFVVFIGQIGGVGVRRASSVPSEFYMTRGFATVAGVY